MRKQYEVRVTLWFDSLADAIAFMARDEWKDAVVDLDTRRTKSDDDDDTGV